VYIFSFIKGIVLSQQVIKVQVYQNYIYKLEIAASERE